MFVRRWRILRLRRLCEKKTKKIAIFVSILLIGSTFNHYAAVTTAQSLHVGNFSLLNSQQPGPFVSFGQNIIDKNQLQVFLFPSYLKVSQEHYLTAAPALLYGFSDTTSLLLTFPVAADYVVKNDHASGYGDTGLQGEYAFYNQNNHRYADQATLVGGLTLPTGSPYKTPPIGQGSPSYFIGGTYSRTDVDWYFFTSPGALISQASSNSPGVTHYLYQAGIGRNIKSIPDQYIVLALFELNGQYSQYSAQFNGPGSGFGENVVLATPSLWLSTNQFILQLGLSTPLTSHWINAGYYASASIGWTLK